MFLIVVNSKTYYLQLKAVNDTQEKCYIYLHITRSISVVVVNVTRTAIVKVLMPICIV